MYKLSLILLITLFVSFFSSCRKTVTDPLISLRSRENRVEGEWSVISYTKKRVITNRDTSIKPATEQFYMSGDDFVVNIGNCWNIYQLKKWVYKFDKIGNFEIKKNTRATQLCNLPTDGDSINYETESGYWSLTGGARNAKNKTELLIYTTNYTNNWGRYTFSSNVTAPSPTSYQLLTLKNKEMVLKIQNEYSYLDLNQNGASVSETIDMILIQK